MRLGAFFGFRDARLRDREPEMFVGGGIVVGRGAGVAGRASAGEHRARRYDEVEEAQRRLRQRQAQLRAPEAERSPEEAGEHLFGIYVVRAPINACRTPAAGGAWVMQYCGALRSDEVSAAAAAAMASRYSAPNAVDV